MSEDIKEIYVDGCLYKTKVNNKFLRRNLKPQLEDPHIVRAFIPGVIKKILVKEGDSVKRGEKLLILEAMKMENYIMSATSGKIKKIHTQEGKVVCKHELLLEID